MRRPRRALRCTRLGWLAGAFACGLLGSACAPKATTSQTPTPPESEAEPAVAPPVAWVDWAPAAFAAAEASDKLILIDVEASWCHWCHVMDETTYADAAVRRRLAANFVTVRVDADARPDVAERYAAWGWPATIVLDPAAREVRAWRGFVPAERFVTELDALAQAHRDGTLELTPLTVPESQGATPTAAGLDQVWARLVGQVDATYDPAKPGWGRAQMYPIGALLEASLVRPTLEVKLFGAEPSGGKGEGKHVDVDVDHAARARAVFAALAPLRDPHWGGVYQYSVGGVWDRPHFEKLSLLQADMLRAYAQLAAHVDDPEARADALAKARAIYGYLDAHLRTDQGFGVSQDADLRTEGQAPVEGKRYYALDDAGRRALGEPRRDLNVYADVNAALAGALARMARVDPAGPWRAQAIERMQGLADTHAHPDGGFSHAPTDQGAPRARYLGDQAHALYAYVELYELTGDRQWRGRAESLAGVLLEDFADPRGGFASVSADPDATGVFAQARRPPELNAIVARALMRLHRQLDHDEGKSLPYEAAAKRALLALGTEASLRPEGRFLGQFMLATLELAAPGVWITVVPGHGGGGGEDASARAQTQDMHAAAVLAAMARPDVVVDRSPAGEYYPGHAQTRAFVCDASRCSRPITDAAKLGATVASW